MSVTPLCVTPCLLIGPLWAAVTKESNSQDNPEIQPPTIKS